MSSKRLLVVVHSSKIGIWKQNFFTPLLLPVSNITRNSR